MKREKAFNDEKARRIVRGAVGYPFFPPGRDAPRAGGQGGYNFNGKRMKITFAGRDHPRAPRPARGARGHGGEARGEGSFFFRRLADLCG